MDWPVGKYTGREKSYKFDKPTRFLDENQLEWFRTTYGLFPGEISKGRFAWCPDTRQVVHPIFSPDRRQRGVLLRDYNDKMRMRVLKEALDEPLLCWYTATTNADSGRYVVVVEDHLSALKLSRYYTAACLLGTNMSDDKALELAVEAACIEAPKVVLLLDADAYAKSLDYGRRYSGLIDNFIVEQCGDADPKYWPDDDLKNLL